MTTWLLSVDPVSADHLLSGRARFEFRRVRTSIAVGDRCLIYATSPQSSFAGEFMVDRVVIGSPAEIISETIESVPYGRPELEQYLAGCNVGSAIGTGSRLPYLRPPAHSALRREFPGFTAPRSYCRASVEIVSIADEAARASRPGHREPTTEGHP